MKIQLSDHFTYGKLLRFTLPSIIMMVFTSIYSVVDGFFVSNYAGSTALAAVNLGFPYIMMLASAGFMIGSGGSALVAKILGQGDKKRALETFSLFIYFAIILGGALTAFGYFAAPDVLRSMGATGDLLESARRYTNILLAGLPFFILQQAFQSFFIAAGKPQIGLGVTVAAGVANMLLDYLLVGVAGYGLAGAGWATAVSQMSGGLIALLYFIRPNSSTLRLGRGPFRGRSLAQGCMNGLSELVSNISGSIVGMLFNAQLLRFVGETGVAAYSVLMYVNFVFLSVYIGYAVGTNPVVAFAYGAGKPQELRSLLRKSLVIILICALGMTTLAEIAGESISKTFVGYDLELLDLTHRGFEIYSFAFLFSGFTILGSAFFTGLNNGVISAIISISRTLVFQVSCVLILPPLLGVEGIWLSVVIAEILACAVNFICLGAFKKKYGY